MVRLTATRSSDLVESRCAPDPQAPVPFGAQVLHASLIRMQISALDAYQLVSRISEYSLKGSFPVTLRRQQEEEL